MHSIFRFLATATLAATLTYCSSSPVSESVVTRGAPIGVEISSTVDVLLSQADSARSPDSQGYLMDAVDLLLEQQSELRAGEILARISNPDELPPTLQTRYAISRATLSLRDGDTSAALEWLSGDLVSGINTLDAGLQARFWSLRASAYRDNNQPLEAIADLSRYLVIASMQDSLSASEALWQTLASLDSEQLDGLASAADSYELRGWVELARLMRSQQHSIKNQLDALVRWRAVWTRHPAANELPVSLAALETIWADRPRQIALLLPLHDQIGKAVQEGFFSAFYEALNQGEDVPRIAVYDTSPLLNPDTPQDIRDLYDTAISEGAELVVGPLDKNLVRQLQSQQNLPVPTLALNYSDYPGRNSTNFFQFGLAPEDEIQQAVRLAWQAGHRHAAIVSPGGADYLRLGETFSNFWSSLGGAVVSRATFNSESEYADIIKRLLAIDASEARAAKVRALLPRNDVEFVPRRRQDIDFIFLMANPRQGRQIKPTLAFYFAGDIPVYALSAIYDGLENPVADRDLNGIVFTDMPWLLRGDDPLKQVVTENLRGTQGPLQRLRALGIDSFRLYPRLNQLASGQLMSFDGTTGVLTMTTLGSIQRRPDAAVFVNGAVRIAGAGGVASSAPR